MGAKKQTIFSFVLVFAILMFLISKVNISEITKNLNEINIFYYLLGLIVFYISFFPRGLRWNILLKNIGIKKRTKELSEIYYEKYAWVIRCRTETEDGKNYLQRRY